MSRACASLSGMLGNLCLGHLKDHWRGLVLGGMWKEPWDPFSPSNPLALPLTGEGSFPGKGSHSAWSSAWASVQCKKLLHDLVASPRGEVTGLRTSSSTSFSCCLGLQSGRRSTAGKVPWEGEPPGAEQRLLTLVACHLPSSTCGRDRRVPWGPIQSLCPRQQPRSSIWTHILEMSNEEMKQDKSFSSFF